MAITYKRKEDGSFSKEYSGFDKARHEFGNVLENVKSVGKKAVKAIASAPKKYVKAVVDANKRYDQAQARKELDDISRGFGSVENYESMYPETKKRHDELRKRAGY